MAPAGGGVMGAVGSQVADKSPAGGVDRAALSLCFAIIAQAGSARLRRVTTQERLTLAIEALENGEDAPELQRIVLAYINDSFQTPERAAQVALAGARDWLAARGSGGQAVFDWASRKDCGHD